MKKILSFMIICSILLFVLTGCGNDEVANNATNTSKNTTSKNTANTSTTKNTSKEESKVSVDYEEAAKKQMANPEAGETVATIHIKNYGDVKVKFFEEVAPKAVENFVTHAKEGYYDGVTCHRVINEFMIQSGDPLGNGTG